MCKDRLHIELFDLLYKGLYLSGFQLFSPPRPRVSREDLESVASNLYGSFNGFIDGTYNRDVKPYLQPA